MKQYVGFVCDHTGSMSGLRSGAMNDYNSQIETVKTESKQYNIDTSVSVVQCGINRSTNGPTLLRPPAGYRYNSPNSKYHNLVNVSVVNSDAQALGRLTQYNTPGNSTPLLDAVMQLIDVMSNVPDVNDPETSFLVMVITDGGENSSNTKALEFSARISDLIATDRWTFVFRVPRGHKGYITRLGISEGNVDEWDTTQKGIERSTQITTSGFSNYYAARSTGQKSTTRFFADTSKLTTKKLEQNLNDISYKVNVFPVATKDNGKQIRDFVTEKYGNYYAGCAFYQLVKTEQLQENKIIIIYDKLSGSYYTGAQARTMIGLPQHTSCSVSPTNFKNYEIFIQSTSYNRKVVAGTKIVVYT